MMNFNLGDKVLFVSDFSDPNSIKEYTITKIGKDTIQCGNAENTMYKEFAFPARVYSDLVIICKIQQDLKKQLNDSMTLVYQLRNAISKGEK